jgi:hypothetical protein
VEITPAEAAIRLVVVAPVAYTTGRSIKEAVDMQEVAGGIMAVVDVIMALSVVVVVVDRPTLIF